MCTKQLVLGSLYLKCDILQKIINPFSFLTYLKLGNKPETCDTTWISTGLNINRLDGDSIFNTSEHAPLCRVNLQSHSHFRRRVFLSDDRAACLDVQLLVSCTAMHIDLTGRH